MLSASASLRDADELDANLLNIFQRGYLSNVHVFLDNVFKILASRHCSFYAQREKEAAEKLIIQIFRRYADRKPENNPDLMKMTCKNQALSEAFNTNEKMSDENYFNKLSVEIIPEILYHLPTTDLKNASQVCKLFYTASCEKRIRMNQKLVIDGIIHETKDIISCLSKCQWKYQNVEFRSVRFSPISPSLSPEYFNCICRDYWKRCGHLVRSINFSCCLIPDDIMENILQSCVNLEHLSVKNDYISKKPFSSNVLETLIQKRTGLKNLKSLVIDLGTFESAIISRNMLSDILKAFSSITSLKLICSRSSYENLSYFNFSDILRCGNLLPIIVNGVSIEIIPPDPGNSRLKEVDLRFDDELCLTKINNFFSKHVHLEECKIEMCDSFKPLILAAIFTSCPNLQHLSIDWTLTPNDKEFLRKDEIKKLLNLNLKTLRINSYNISFEEDLNQWIREYCPQNKTLRFLSISLVNTSPVNLKLFLRMFPNLRQLELQVLCYNSVAQTIWKYHTNLKSLIIDSFCESLYVPGSYCTTSGLTGSLEGLILSPSDTHYSINRLQKLEYLELKDARSRTWSILDLLRHLNLPKLRYLNLLESGEQCDLSEALLILAERSTLLEKVKFSVSDTPCGAIAEFASRLPRLRHLHMTHSFPKLQFHDVELTMLFNWCQSLRCVIYHRLPSITKTYYFDHLSCRLLKLSSTYASEECHSTQWPRDLKFW